MCFILASEFALEVVRHERKSSCQSALPGMHRRDVPVRSAFRAETLAVDRLTRRPRLGRFALAATVSLVLIGGCANTPTRNGSLAPTEPVVTGDPWVFLGMMMVTESDGFVDPLVFELEDAIIPESITGSRRDRSR